MKLFNQLMKIKLKNKIQLRRGYPIGIQSERDLKNE